MDVQVKIYRYFLHENSGFINEEFVNVQKNRLKTFCMESFLDKIKKYFYNLLFTTGKTSFALLILLLSTTIKFNLLLLIIFNELTINNYINY